jgi:hypothetical protein
VITGLLTEKGRKDYLSVSKERRNKKEKKKPREVYGDMPVQEKSFLQKLTAKFFPHK